MNGDGQFSGLQLEEVSRVQTTATTHEPPCMFPHHPQQKLLWMRFRCAISIKYAPWKPESTGNSTGEEVQEGQQEQKHPTSRLRRRWYEFNLTFQNI